MKKILFATIATFSVAPLFSTQLMAAGSERTGLVAPDHLFALKQPYEECRKAWDWDDIGKPGDGNYEEGINTFLVKLSPQERVKNVAANPLREIFRTSQNAEEAQSEIISVLNGNTKIQLGTGAETPLETLVQEAEAMLNQDAKNLVRFIKLALDGHDQLVKVDRYAKKWKSNLS